MKITKSATRNIWNLLRFDIRSEAGYGIGLGIAVNKILIGFYHDKSYPSTAHFGLSFLGLNISVLTPSKIPKDYFSKLEKWRIEMLRKDKRLGFDFSFQPNHFVIGFLFSKDVPYQTDADFAELYRKIRGSNPSRIPTVTSIGIALLPFKANIKFPSSVRDKFYDANKIEAIST